jgi:hypothetical protein
MVIVRLADGPLHLYALTLGQAAAQLLDSAECGSQTRFHVVEPEQQWYFLRAFPEFRHQGRRGHRQRAGDGKQFVHGDEPGSHPIVAAPVLDVLDDIRAQRLGAATELLATCGEVGDPPSAPPADVPDIRRDDITHRFGATHALGRHATFACHTDRLYAELTGVYG